MEMEIWSVWATNRIPGAIGGLTTIIAIWVAARFASVASEQSDENKTIFGKILLTVFGACVIWWGMMINLFTQGNWYATANAFKNLKESGADISDGAARFAETWSVEPSLMNQPVTVLFFISAFLIILFPIWFKK